MSKAIKDWIPFALVSAFCVICIIYISYKERQRQPKIVEVPATIMGIQDGSYQATSVIDSHGHIGKIPGWWGSINSQMMVKCANGKITK